MNPAFAYVYDECLTDRRFERELALIETALGERGIAGRVGRLALFRNAKEMMADLSQSGVKNLIFVGNDQTLLKHIWCVPEGDLTLGYLPVCPPSDLATLLRIPVGLAAVEVLAARFVATVDVGLADEVQFLTEVVIQDAAGAVLEIDDNYHLTIPKHGALAVRNLGGRVAPGAERPNPHDGFLEAVIEAKQAKRSLLSWGQKSEIHQTRIPFLKAWLKSEQPLSMFIDGQSVQKKQISFSLAPRSLRVILGRNIDATVSI